MLFFRGKEGLDKAIAIVYICAGMKDEKDILPLVSDFERLKQVAGDGRNQG